MVFSLREHLVTSLVAAGIACRATTIVRATTKVSGQGPKGYFGKIVKE